MTTTLIDPAVYVAGSDWKHLEWQFTLGGQVYQWITAGGATATCKIVRVDDGKVVLDDGDTQTVTLTDTGKAQLDVSTAIAATLTAGRYRRRYKFTLAGGEIEKSPPIQFDVQADI